MDDDFTRLQGKWSQQSDADNLFVGTDKGYDVWRKNSKSGFFLFSEKNELFSVFESYVHFTFDPKGNKNQSAGLILQAQPDGTGALIIEINKKRQYRIRRAVNNRLISLTGEGEGWVKSKKAISSGENMIMVRTYDKIYDLYINGQFIKSFTEIEYGSGKIGLYIGASSKVLFHRLSVKTDEDHLNTDNTGGPVDEEKTLAQVIVKLKESINKKDKRIQELEAEVRAAGVRTNSDTALIRQKQEAESKVAAYAREIQNLKYEVSSLQSKVAVLEEFKRTVKESENGDVIINLTKLMDQQKEQIAQLQRENKSLSITADQLRSDKTELNAQLNKLQNETDNLRNEKIGLLQRIIEKDSMIGAQEERIKLTDDALEQCTRNCPKPKKEKTRKKSSSEATLQDE